MRQGIKYKCYQIKACILPSPQPVQPDYMLHLEVGRLSQRYPQHKTLAPA